MTEQTIAQQVSRTETNTSDAPNASVNKDGGGGRLDEIAAELYRLGSMLVGEGEDGVLVVETAVENGALSGLDGSGRAGKASREILCAAAFDTLTRRDAASLAAPEWLEHAATCIGDDELDGGGVSSAELEQLIAGPERHRMRDWLESLPVAMRTIFVLRVVAGFTAAEAAELLVAHGGPQAGAWTGEAVRELYRQAVCSLASQVLQASGR